MFDIAALNVRQKETFRLFSFLNDQMPPPSLSFDGLANADNVAAFGLIIAPPDMLGEAGPNHYVQIANTLFRVYNKAGQPLTNPVPINALFQNLGTPCSNRNDGLPNLIYDQLADRWVISQVCTNYPPFRQMIAVSQTGDPLGVWHAYEFVMPNVKLNDFPKISMWPDGYVMTTNEFLGSDHTGNGVFAFDRERMLKGDPDASYIYFSIPAQRSFPVGVLPADLEGMRPPPEGTPAIIATHTADEYGQPDDAIKLFDFHADFSDPLASYLVERSESPITVSPFDPTSPEGRADIAQPVPGLMLDSVSDTLMPRLAYRNVGDRQMLVVNQTVRTTVGVPYRAGVRVYELQNSDGSYVPSIQSTIGDAESSRWIGSAAQDHQGNLAVQYNFVTDEKPVSIVYSGRLAGDAPGSFRQERTLVDGTGVQKGFGWRWGEYSAMSVDPTDDCTFWTTNAYYTSASQKFSDWGWITRIGSFKFDECTPAPGGSIVGKITDAATGQPVADAYIATAVYSRSSISDGTYGPLALLPGHYELKINRQGYSETIHTIEVENGDAQTHDFALQPIPAITQISNDVVSESCGLDRAIEPGETVTYSIAFRNEGAADIASLSAQLRPGGGVISTGPAQNYGPMPAGGAGVSRPFSFTVDPNVKCGARITLSFDLFDGAKQIGQHSIQVTTGKPQVTLQENFDRTPLGGLPPRWTRQGFAANGTADPARSWRLSQAHATSGTKSLFSPAPNQAGWNGVVSPIFKIGSEDAVLSFQNWYELETTFLRNRLFDGSVLEIKVGENDWQDIIAAGGAFISGGYDGAIDACCQNPLAGHQGWSGWSGINRPAEFVTTEVKLPSAASGQFVQLRWRVGTDIGTFREGQYIDDVVVTDGMECLCGSP